MSKQEDIVYRFQPANPGDNYRSHGIPARDLTARDVAKLSGAALANLEAVGPSGKPMYVKVDPKPAAAAKPEPKDEKRD